MVNVSFVLLMCICTLCTSMIFLKSQFVYKLFSVNRIDRRYVSIVDEKIKIEIK